MADPAATHVLAVACWRDALGRNVIVAALHEAWVSAPYPSAPADARRDPSLFLAQTVRRFTVDPALAQGAAPRALHPAAALTRPFADAQPFVAETSAAAREALAWLLAQPRVADALQAADARADAWTTPDSDVRGACAWRRAPRDGDLGRPTVLKLCIGWQRAGGAARERIPLDGVSPMTPALTASLLATGMLAGADDAPRVVPCAATVRLAKRHPAHADVLRAALVHGTHAASTARAALAALPADTVVPVVFCETVVLEKTRAGQLVELLSRVPDTPGDRAAQAPVLTLAHASAPAVPPADADAAEAADNARAQLLRAQLHPDARDPDTVAGILDVLRATVDNLEDGDDDDVLRAVRWRVLAYCDDRHLLDIPPHARSAVAPAPLPAFFRLLYTD